MKSVLYRVKNSIQNLVPAIIDRRGVFDFGEKNDLPNHIIRTIAGSGTASSCIEKLDTFIQADGFIDPAIGAKKANRKQTFEDMLEDMSLYASYFPAVAIRVYFNAEGLPKLWENVPVTHIRSNADGTYKINPDTGTKKHRKSDDITVSAFVPGANPLDRVQQMKAQISTYGKQVGQLYYVFKKSALDNGEHYPIPTYTAGLDDIESDGKLSRLEKNNIAKGWRSQVIVTTPPIDNQTKDENGLTDKNKFDSTMKGFTGEDAATIAHIQSTSEHFEPKVTLLDIKATLDATEKATPRISNKVCRLLNVPPVLIGMAEAGKLGNTQELINHMKLFNLSVNKAQRRISRALHEVTKDNPEFTKQDWTLTTLNVFSYIPDALLNKLSKEEIAEILEISLPEPKTPSNGNSNEE